MLATLIFPATHADSQSDGSSQPPSGGNPMVVLNTSLGDITVELDAEKAPITVKNFLDYVNAGFYDGTIFHRVIRGFMIQGGGMTPDMQQKATQDPIRNEADNGLKNLRGTLAMARTQAKDSATAQFFINLVDNAFLDHNDRDFGYAVFGKVVQGMDVLDKIGDVKTGRQSGQSDVPNVVVQINSAQREASSSPPDDNTKQAIESLPHDKNSQ